MRNEKMKGGTRSSGRVRTVWLCVGLPGSGKSSWAGKKAGTLPKAVILCRDDFRQMFLGRYAVRNDVEDLVSVCVRTAFRSALSMGFDVILDETNLSRKTRAYWIRTAKDVSSRVRVVCVHFPEEDRNLEFRMKAPKGLSRTRWAGVISRMKRGLEPPSLSEGCDRILQIAFGDPERKRQPD